MSSEVFTYQRRLTKVSNSLKRSTEWLQFVVDNVELPNGVKAIIKKQIKANKESKDTMRPTDLIDVTMDKLKEQADNWKSEKNKSDIS